MINKAVFATTTALCLSLSGQAAAFGLDSLVGGLAGGGPSTEATQKLNNAQLLMLQERQVEELSAAMQLLESANISGQASEIMGQMEGLAEQTGYILEETPPEELTACETTMSTKQFRDRMEYRKSYTLDVSSFFAETLAELSDGSGMLMNLSNALTTAGEPVSPIVAQQADVLAQASAVVAEQRDQTKELMIYKEDQIEQQLDDADSCAIQAHNTCVMTGECPDGESMSYAEEKTITSGFGSPESSEIGTDMEPNSAGLLADGTASSTLHQVLSNGDTKVVETYGDGNDADCDAQAADLNSSGGPIYFCE